MSHTPARKPPYHPNQYESLPDGELGGPQFLDESDAQPEEKIQGSSAALASVYLSIAVDLLGFGIVLPYLPFLAIKFISKESERGFYMGVLASAFSVAQMVGSIVLGRMSDCLGRKPVLVTALFMTVVTLVIMGFVHDYYELLAIRAFDGLFAGGGAVAQAYIADVVPESKRPQYMGLVGAAAGFGLVIGPALGGLISIIPGGNFHVACYVAAGITLLNTMLALCLVRESNPGALCCAPRRLPEKGAEVGGTPTSATPKRGHSPVGSLCMVFRNSPVLLLLFGANFFMNFGFTIYETVVPLYSYDRFHVRSEMFVGALLLGFGVVMIINQGFVIRLILKKLSPRAATIMGSILFSTFAALVPFTRSIGLMVVVFLLSATGVSYPNTCIMAMSSNYSDHSTHGLVLGLLQGAGAIARAGGPLVSGVVYDVDSYLSFFLAGGAAAMTAVCMLMICSPGAEAPESSEAVAPEELETSLMNQQDQ